jgi:hypothetical protein
MKRFQRGSLIVAITASAMLTLSVPAEAQNAIPTMVNQCSALGGTFTQYVTGNKFTYQCCYQNLDGSKGKTCDYYDNQGNLLGSTSHDVVQGTPVVGGRPAGPGLTEEPAGAAANSGPLGASRPAGASQPKLPAATTAVRNPPSEIQ